MKAAVLHAVNQPLTVEDVALTKPGPREVLIRTSVAGMTEDYSGRPNTSSGSKRPRTG